MNAKVLELVAQIEAADDGQRKGLLLELLFLVEKNFTRNTQDPLYGEFLPDALFRLNLAEEEQSEIVAKIGSLMGGGHFSKDEIVSCITTLGKLKDLAGLGFILAFLRHSHESLAHADVYSILAAIHPLTYSGTQEQRAIALFHQYELRSVLDSTRLRHDPHVDQQVVRLCSSLDRLEGKNSHN